MITLILTFIISTASAQSTTEMTVQGIVTQFDEKTIELKQANGAIVRVPRTPNDKMQGIKIGKDLHVAKVSSSQFLKLNPQHFKSIPRPPPPKSKLQKRLHGEK